MVPTSSGGFGGGVPRIRSSTQEPRIMGEVVVPLAVTLRMLPMVSSPPRWLSLGKVTRAFPYRLRRKFRSALQGVHSEKKSLIAQSE